MVMLYKTILYFIWDSFEYILFLLIAILLLFNRKKIAYYIFLIVLVCFGGFRGGLGNDFVNYYKWYYIKINDKFFEIGYVGIMNLFAYLNLSIYHIQFVFFTGTLIFISLAIRKFTINYKFASLYYLVFPYFFLYSFILMRQYIAMAIVFWSFQFLLKNEPFQYIIAILIGSLFHYTCLLAGFLVYFIFFLSKIISKKQIIFFLLLSIPFAFINWFHFFGFLFEGTKYELYFLEKNMIQVNYIKLILFNIEALFIFYFYNELINFNPNNKFFIFLTLFAFILANIFASVNYLVRFSLYFRFFEIIILADITHFNRKRIYVVLLITLYGLSYFFNVLLSDYKSTGIHTKLVPYQNILFKK